jgi:hypothetical protein
VRGGGAEGGVSEVCMHVSWRAAEEIEKGQEVGSKKASGID